jgi:hypothetical protein
VSTVQWPEPSLNSPILHVVANAEFRRRAIGRLPSYNATLDTIDFPLRQHTRLRVSLAPVNTAAHDLIACNRITLENTMTLDGTLQLAQREVLEQEIFSFLIKEAGELPTSSARVSEQLIVVEAAQNVELRFELVRTFHIPFSGFAYHIARHRYLWNLLTNPHPYRILASPQTVPNVISYTPPYISFSSAPMHMQKHSDSPIPQLSAQTTQLCLYSRRVCCSQFWTCSSTRFSASV